MAFTVASMTSFLTTFSVLSLGVHVFLAYFALNAISTWRIVRKQGEYPLIGSPISLVPKVVLNLLYAWKASDLAHQGYSQVCYSLHCFFSTTASDNPSVFSTDILLSNSFEMKVLSSFYQSPRSRS